MFHLTNSVYVNLDRYMDRVNLHYNVSMLTGTKAVVYDDTVITDRTTTQLDYVLSVSEITEGRFRRWLTSMKSDTVNRIMVWVDPAAYITLAAINILAMSPNMTKEELRFFLTMTMVELDSTRIANGEHILEESNKFQVSEQIDTIYKEAVRLSPIMRTVLYDDPCKWSLEYRIAEHIATGKDLGIQSLLKRILVRATVMTCFEALFEVKHLIGNPATWEALGCTEETLLNAPSVFAGMTAFQQINSKWMLTLDPNDHNVDMVDIQAAAKEAIVIFNLAGDDRKVQTLNEQLDTLTDLIDERITIIDVLHRMFGPTVHGTRPCDRDCSKYNSVIIGHFLSKV